LPSRRELRSLAVPAARNVMSRTTAMPARSSATLCSAALLIAVGRQTRDYGGKLPEHLRPTERGTPKRLIAPRLGDVEA